MTDQSALREKLRLIRDSDHPASPWASVAVQTLDELKASPDDPVLLRQLGKNVAMFEKAMHDSVLSFQSQLHLTPAEIASIFGLGGEG